MDWSSLGDFPRSRAHLATFSCFALPLWSSYCCLPHSFYCWRLHFFPKYIKGFLWSVALLKWANYLQFLLNFHLLLVCNE